MANWSIPTDWNGKHFRSRLEAKWSYLFDALHLDYQYEPQCFRLPGGVGYLPDFYFPKLDAFIEVKPTIEEDCSKPIGLAESQDKRVFVAIGEPGHDPDSVQLFHVSPSGGKPARRARFIDCPACRSVSIDWIDSDNPCAALSCLCFVESAFAMALWTPKIPSVLADLIIADSNVQHELDKKLKQWRKNPRSGRIVKAFDLTSDTSFRPGMEPDPIEVFD